MKFKWFAKKEKDKQVALPADNEQNNTRANKPEGAFIVETKRTNPLKKFLPKPSRRVVVVSVFIMILLAGGITYWVIDQKPFMIGSHTVLKKDLANSSDAIKNAYEANDHDASEAERLGREQAVLLAALKTEADKRNIKYGKAEIDKILQESFDFYGSREQFFRHMQEENKWTEEDVYRYRTVEYLKEKLQADLIARRTYALMFVRWDNLRANNPDNFEQLYKQKEELLKNKYLPYFRLKADVNTLASLADYADGASEEQQMKAFSSSDGVPVSFTVTEMGFGDLLKYDEGEDMLTTLQSIESVGDFVGPFKSNMGILVIARLEKSEGGPYRNWDHFREHYEKISGVSFGPSVFSRIVSSVKSLVGNSQHNPILPKKAEAAATNCLETHPVRYELVYIDKDTGAPLPASAISGIQFAFGANRAMHLCTAEGYSKNGWSVGKPFQYANHTWRNVSKLFKINTSNANVRVEVDCNGPAWGIFGDPIRSIPGYVYVNKTMPPGQSSPFEWKASLNGDANHLTYLFYRKVAKPFDVSPSRTIDPNTGRVNFAASNRKEGAARLNDRKGVMIDRRVWVNNVIRYTKSQRIIINGNATWAESWTPSNPLPGGAKVCASISVRPPTGYTDTTVYNPNAASRSAGSRTADCVTIPRPTKISCDNIVINPSPPIPGQDLSIQGNFRYSGGVGSGNRSYTITLNAPGFDITNREVGNGSFPNNGNGVISTEVVNISGSDVNPGSHQVTFTISANGVTYDSPAPNCSETINVSRKPYFRVYGGDVVVGRGFKNGNSCTPTEAKIQAFTRQDGSNWAGAGSQFAASAVSEINDFLTASMHNPDTGGTSRPPTALALGNIASPFGKDRGAYQDCVTDYFAWATDPNGGAGSNPGDEINGLTIGKGQSKIFVHTGDLRITDNIKYNTDARGSDLANIPSFFLVVKGNIHIAPGVTQLDGVYIAQPNGGSGGDINTCYHPDPDDYTGCDNQLVVNGAFAAKNVLLRRTNGNVSVASTNEPAGSGEIAEVFNFTPEILLGLTNVQSGNTSSLGRYDAVVGLPPIL